MSELKGGYSSALDFIMRRELFGMKLGLDNISKFLEKIGNPQNSFRSIHLAGTNGKGSTAAYIESILRQANYRTGIFTSPHLVDYRERIKVNGEQIEKRFVTAFVRKYRNLISRNRVTFFETCTALAFCYFAYKKVDIAVIETGLGGRLDATNTLTPLLSIITDISFDHTNILGETLREIAYEKAGIIKENVPVLLGLMKPEPRTEIKHICQERKASMSYLRKSQFSRTDQFFAFAYHHNSWHLDKLRSSLPGNHQINNASLAIYAIELLGRLGFPAGKQDIRAGLKKTYWPGRFQTIKSRDKPTVILDVGHNPAGIKAMVDCFKLLNPGRKAYIVVGFVRNKNLPESVGYINSIADRVEIVRLNTHRTAEPEEIAPYFSSKKPVSISDSVPGSARKLIDLAGPDDIIIVCGSHYAVGDFMVNRGSIL